VTYCGDGSTDEPKEEKNKKPDKLCSERMEHTMLVSAMYGPDTDPIGLNFVHRSSRSYIHEEGP